MKLCIWFLPLLLVGCGAPPGETKIVITGASTLAALTSEIGKAFEQTHPGVRIDVQTGGSTRGVNDARAGLSDIGMVSRDLYADEGDLHPVKIALDGVGLIAHASNSVGSLTDAQVRSIYTGQITNWAEVGGRDAPFVIVHKAEGRSTLEVFCSRFGLKNSQIKPHVVIGDNEQGVKTVAGNADAIGYVSIGTAEHAIANGATLKLLSLNGVAATSQNVAKGAFPLSRPLQLVTQGPPEGIVKEFLEFASSSRSAALIREQNFVPLR